MELKHRFTVPASVDTTWQLFNDLERVAPCFPGAALTSAEGDEFAGTVKVKLGPVSLQYSGSGRFLERDESRTSPGSRRRARTSAATAPHRRPSGPRSARTGGERGRGEHRPRVTGKPAQFGRGLMQDVSDKLLARFVDCLTERLSAAGVGSEQPADGAARPPLVGSVRSRRVPDRRRPRPVAARPTETAPAAAPTTPARHRSREPAGDEEAELDLGATVLPLLARRYGPAVLVARGAAAGAAAAVAPLTGAGRRHGVVRVRAPRPGPPPCRTPRRPSADPRRAPARRAASARRRDRR